MEVKDVLKFDPLTDLKTAPISVSDKGVSPLSENPGNKTDQVTITSNPEVATLNKSRATTNDLISTVNVLSDVTDHVSSIIEKVAGIVDKNDSASLDQLPALEDKSNALLDTVGKIVADAAPQLANTVKNAGVNPEIEKTIAHALDVLLPGDSEHPGGLAKFKFSTKENIIATHLALARAREQFEQLQNSISSIAEKTKDFSSAVDVQNQSVHRGAVRELDGAVKLSNLTQKIITTDHQAAIESIGSLSGAHAVNRI